MNRLITAALVAAIVATGCGGTSDEVRTRAETTAAAPATAAAAAEPPAGAVEAPAATPAAEPEEAASVPAEPAAPEPAPVPPAPAGPDEVSGGGPAGDPGVDAIDGSTDPDDSGALIDDGDLTERVVAALQDRSFRQFDPSPDAGKRKAVILDFFSGIELWAQYAEGNHALVEWQIRADLYRVEGEPDGSEVTLYFVDPKGSQILPTECATCVGSKNVSISVMNVFDPERIAFKVNDPYGVLQSPFPVFNSWKRFGEDEIFD